jgi:hypothetical protein
MNRRIFLGRLLKGAGVTLLGFVPGTFFSRKKLYAQVESFQNVFSRTTKSNVYDILKASTLPGEQKLAILAVRELGRDEVTRLIEFWGKGDPNPAPGDGCGANCGNGCGNNCNSQIRGVIGVFNKDGNLKVKFSSVSRNVLKSALQQALNF